MTNQTTLRHYITIVILCMCIYKEAGTHYYTFVLLSIGD